MRRRLRLWTAVFSLLIVSLASPLPSEQPQGKFADPVPMAADRAEDSYEIYSFLLVHGPIEGREWRRSLWLIRDTTEAAPLDAPCHPFSVGAFYDPHNLVTPPPERKADWLELLADYDRHCHDAIRLDGNQFHLALPVRLLGEQESKDARSNDFYGAGGLESFSGVYFNPPHTLALVHQSMGCKGACGMSMWVVLERDGGGWKVLPWQSRYMIS